MLAITIRSSTQRQRHVRALPHICVFINKLAVTVAYPFLLEVYHDYATKRISEATLEAVLAMMQSYVWRRFLCNVPTNALNKVFALLYKDIANASTEAEYRRLLEQTLMRRRTNQRFPNDWEVQEALNTKDMYNIQPKNRMYFLERMENHGHRIPTHPIPTYVEGNPNVSVEHIFPQRAGDVWRRELGAQRFEQMQKLLQYCSKPHAHGIRIQRQHGQSFVYTKA